jgi:hypothetical protein
VGTYGFFGYYVENQLAIYKGFHQKNAFYDLDDLKNNLAVKIQKGISMLPTLSLRDTSIELSGKNILALFSNLYENSSISR